MNTNKLLGILGVGAIGYLLYKHFIQLPQQGNTNYNPYSYPNNAYQNAATGGQPSAQYPLRAVEPPRVDNSSEPWYGGSRAFNLGPSGSIAGFKDYNFAQNVEYVKGTVDIAEGLGDLWGNLSGWFGGDDAAPEALGVESFDNYDFFSSQDDYSYYA